MTTSFADNRFTVTFSAQALAIASAGGFSLPKIVAQAIARISALLPGPHTAITVTYGGSHVIPQTGTSGQTNPSTADIAIAFGSTPKVNLSTIMKLWLPRSFSHEIDHSVRALTGPGSWPTLLQQIVAEGISSAFDLSAFPGPPNPWDRAIRTRTGRQLPPPAQTRSSQGATISPARLEPYRARIPRNSA